MLYQKILIDLDNEEKLLNNSLSNYRQHSDSYHHIYNETIEKAIHDSTSLKYNLLRWHNISALIVTNKHQIAIAEISSNNITELLNEKFNIEVLVLQANKSFNDYKNETLMPFFIRSDRLKSQYENVEFVQLLSELRILTSWAILNSENLKKKNSEISIAIEQKLNTP